MEDSDTQNLSKPKLIPIPGLKPKQEEAPPESDPVDSAEEGQEPEPADKGKPKLARIIQPEPEPEDTQGGKKDIRKLKLKKAITPLYAKPEKPARTQEQFTGTGKHQIEIPHAEQVPIEEIAPPTPEEKAGLPEIKAAPPQSQQPPIMAAGEMPLKSEPPPPEPPQETVAEPEEEQAAEEVETLVKAKPQKQRSKKPLILIGGALLIAILATAYFIFDPFGHKLEPIEPMSPILSGTNTVTQDETTTPEAVVEGEIPFNPEAIDLDSYLAGLQELKVQAIPNPEGILIEKLCYAKDSLLNPHLDLVIKEIEISHSEVLLTVTDSNSVDHTVPLQR
jgi:hypothetical protein